MSQSLRTRPSDLYGIHDELLAYFFDRAVYTFGTAVEADVREASEGSKDNAQAKRKAMLRLNVWLTDPEPEVQSAPKKFRDPMERLKPKPKE